VVPQKRIFIAAAGALAATLALTACGSDDASLSAAQSAAIQAEAAPAVPAEDLVASEAPEEPVQEADEEPVQESDEEAVQEPEAAAEAEAAEPAAAPKAVVKPVGKATNKLIAKAVPKMGNVVTDDKGFVLYRFDKDKASPPKSNCVGDCAILWPPLLADETLELSGINASKVDTVERADGGLQVTIGGWPVYRYIGDRKPGAWKGQNVGGTWFVVERDGSKNLTCLPKISKPVPLPAKARAANANAAAPAPDAEAGADYDTGGY
jgi:predicted lipoprotein with Yx(FWY)xxD motif